MKPARLAERFLASLPLAARPGNGPAPELDRLEEELGEPSAPAGGPERARPGASGVAARDAAYGRRASSAAAREALRNEPASSATTHSGITHHA